MSAACHKFEVNMLAYCLMPNHAHFIAVPSTEKSFAGAMRKAHQAYAEVINHREGWRGCLWQGRYFSAPMDDHHLIQAITYILNNPVRAGLVSRAVDWCWSSAKAHLSRESDVLVHRDSLSWIISDWHTLLNNDKLESYDKIRQATKRGRPIGDRSFYEKIEALCARSLWPQKGGRKKSKQI